MEDEDGILLHEKDLWEIILGELLSLKVDSLLHHVTCAKTTKNAWDNFYARFERRHVGNKL